MSLPFAIDRIHHVAYRCRDARETVEFYRDVLGMEFTTAFAEDHVPSTGDYDPYMHIFLDCGGGNVLAVGVLGVFGFGDAGTALPPPPARATLPGDPEEAQWTS